MIPNRKNFIKLNFPIKWNLKQINQNKISSILTKTQIHTKKKLMQSQNHDFDSVAIKRIALTTKAMMDGKNSLNGVKPIPLSWKSIQDLILRTIF